jgi:murein DD-endopeptidase MepM/ murein hydrolase activator NlpD
MDMDDAYQGRPDPHWGKDIVAAIGVNVRAAKTGIVTYAENRIPGFGRMIWLSHLDGESRSTLYAHLDGFNVGLGQLVQGDDVIGFVGNTCAPEGTTPPCWCRAQPRCAQLNPPQTSRTMGSHLHFEVHTSRIPVMGAARDNIALGRRECLEPVVWLREQGISIVGEQV